MLFVAHSSSVSLLYSKASSNFPYHSPQDNSIIKSQVERDPFLESQEADARSTRPCHRRERQDPSALEEQSHIYRTPRLLPLGLRSLSPYHTNWRHINALFLG